VTLRVALLGSPSARAPAEADLVIAPSLAAAAARDPRACVAAPGALPLRTASIAEIELHASLLPEHLPAAVAEAARVLAPGGRLVARIRLQTPWRSFAAALFRLPKPPPPSALPRLLARDGFDRIEQRAEAGWGVYQARRLPGRPWDLMHPA
jgi:hypothetical protein